MTQKFRVTIDIEVPDDSDFAQSRGLELQVETHTRTEAAEFLNLVKNEQVTNVGVERLPD